MPIFIGYGTADYCDLLPLDFIRLGKHNYTLKPYPGYDHNFNKAEYDKAGNKISSEQHWDEMAKDIFQWLQVSRVKIEKGITPSNGVGAGNGDGHGNYSYS